jgi:hypothetical protein
VSGDDWAKFSLGAAVTIATAVSLEWSRRQNKRLDDHDTQIKATNDARASDSANQREAIARLQERQSATTGWLEAIDKRLEAGFDKLEKKIDEIAKRPAR